MAKDYYNILGVAENASADELKKVYRKLAKQFHPDANSGNKAAEEKFKDVSEAYSVLSDPQKRSQYDQMRKYGASGFGQGGFRPGGFEDFGRFDGSQRGFSFDDLSGFGSVGDIFSALFGDRVPRDGRRREGRGAESNRGAELALTLDITFAEMASGTSKKIKLNREARCDHCNGSGAEPGQTTQSCSRCAGTGVVSQSLGSFAVSRTCPQCLGSGEVNVRPCKSCNGTGKVKASQTVTVKIPAGIESGAKLRLRGLGQAGGPTAKDGDLIVTVRVQPDRFFTRSGSDVICTVPISLSQAIEGTRIKIRSISGHTVLKVPSMTQDGTKFKLKGLGIGSDDRKGNQYVIITMKLPANPTPEERELMDRLHAGQRASV
jgi:molecular chaperone DnaJ